MYLLTIQQRLSNSLKNINSRDFHSQLDVLLPSILLWNKFAKTKTRQASLDGLSTFSFMRPTITFTALRTVFGINLLGNEILDNMEHYCHLFNLQTMFPLFHC